MTDRKETTYNLFIWKSKDWEYIFLEDSYQYWDWTKWLTWNSFNFLTQSELDDRIEEYDWYDYWKDAVNADRTTQWYNDWVEEIKDCWDAELTVRDDSYNYEDWLMNAMEYANKEEETDYEYSDCIWWWRMFDEENIQENYYEYFIPENLETLKKLYSEYEQ